MKNGQDTMKKLAIIDLLFNWPPDGGARIDIMQVANRLSRSLSVTMFVPDFTLYCRRGDIQDTTGFNFDVVRLPFDRFSFNFHDVSIRFLAAIKQFRPDYVFIADGWFLKPYLCLALREYRPFVRFYAYENLCLRSHGVLYVDNDVCHVDYLGGTKADVRKCIACGKQQFGNRVDNLYGQEFYAALANSTRYRNTVRLALSEASGLICNNNLIAERIRRYNHNVMVIPSGIDTAMFSPPSEKHLSGDGLMQYIIFMPGRADDPVKGLSVLSQAAKFLWSRRQDFQIWFTCLGDYTPRESFLKNIGWMRPEELPAIYRQASVCVVPSLWHEPFGIIALEAMACGKPVIVFNRGGLAETVLDKHTGLVIGEPDARRLAQSIDELLDNPERLTVMGHQAREHIVQNYQWDEIISRYYLPLFT